MDKSKRKKKLSLFGAFNIVFMVFLCFYFFSALSSQRKAINNLEITKNSYIEKREGLLKDVEHLREEITLIDSVGYVERAARERLNLIKPQEIVFIDILRQGRFHRDR